MMSRLKVRIQTSIIDFERSFFMKLRKTFLLGLAALLVVSCSKSKDKIPVAKIKDQVITLAQFEEAYSRVNPSYLPQAEGFEKLRQFLDTMIDKEVMAIKADELGYDKDDYVKNGLEAFRKLGFQAAYLKFRVADKVKITDKKLRDYYDKLGTIVTIKQIMVDTEEEAAEVTRLLEEGADFESVCKEHSKGPDAAQGGRVMTVGFGRFLSHFQDELFRQPVGGITKPIESPYGYLIIKVLKIEKMKQRQTFEQIRDEIEPTVRSLEEVRLMNERSEEVRERAGVEFYSENIRIVFEALPPDRPLTTPPKREDEVYPLLTFEEPELDRALATYKDKSITIRDFSDLYDRMSFFERPRREFRFTGIKKILIEIMMNELVQEEMKRSRIEEQPELVELIEKKKEELMVTRLFDELVSKQVVLTMEEIQNYYEDNLELYKIPEKRRFGIVMTGSEDTAQEAYDKLQAGMSLARVAQLYSIDEATRSNLGETDLLARGNQQELDDVGFDLENVGDISKPFQTSRGWVVLKLIERVPERVRSLAEVQNAVEADLKNLRSDARLKELMAKWREDLPIDVFEKNLKKAEVNELSARGSE